MDELTRELARRLAGPAIGAATPDPDEPVAWVDAGDEVIVRRRTLHARIEGGALLLTVELETDQTGRHPLTVPFALSGTAGFTGHVYGDERLVARWGRTLQDALWSALVRTAQDRASATGRQLRAMSLDARHDALRIDTGP